MTPGKHTPQRLTAGERLRGVGALLLLIALTVGLPAVLVAVAGIPFAHGIPSGSQLLDAIRRPDDGQLLVDVLLILAWVGWAAFATTVTVETLAVAKHSVAPALRGLGSLQPYAGRLLATAALLLPGGTAALTLAGGTAHPLAAATAPSRQSATTGLSPEAVAVPALEVRVLTSNVPVVLPVYVVGSDATGERDTLWTIAARHLGNPLRWNDIARLNYGRTQTDGAVFTDPALIRPGWQLQLPPDATGLSRAPEVPTQSPPTRARQLPEVPPPIVAGPDTTPTPAATEPSHGQPSASATPGSAQPSISKPPAEHNRSAGVRISEASEIGGTLAAGILLALSVRRLRRRRSYQPRPPAPAQLVATEAKPAPLRALLAGTASAPATSPASTATAASAADGWDVADSPTGPVLLRWSDYPQLTLTGPGAHDVARAAIATMLIRHPPILDFLVVGAIFETLFPGITPPAEVQQLPTLQAALQFLQIECVRRARRLEQTGVSDATAYRQEHPEDPLPQLILISAEPLSQQSALGDLLEQNGHLGISRVFIAPSPTPNAMEGPAIEIAEDGTVRTAQPQQLLDILAGSTLHHLTSDDAFSLLRTVSIAGESAAETPETDIDPVLLPPEPDWSQPPVTKTAADPEHPIRVQLLGPIRIWVDGEEVTTGLRASARELLAWYLLYPDGRTADAAITAIWPDIALERGPQHFWTALGNLRSRLRTAGQAKPTVLNKAAGAYRPEPAELAVDLWTFQAALQTAGKASEDDRKRDALRRAVDSYHGTFATDADYLWADTIQEEIHRRALDAHTAFALLLLDIGQHSEAIAVYERILELDPHHEDTYRRLMRLQDQTGHLDSSRLLWKQLLSRLAEIDAEPEANTLRLRQDLIRQARHSARRQP